MEMRSGELIARKPVGHDDVEAGLRRITSEHRSLEAGIFLGRLLFDLIRKLKSHSGRTARADDQVRTSARTESATERRRAAVP
jgi:hypothetical protein